MLDEIKVFRKSTELLSKQYDELLKKHNLISEENMEMITEIKEISTNYNNINIKINEMKQNELKGKLVVTGIPILNDRNKLHTLFDELITKLGVPIEDVQLVDIFQGKRIHSATQSAPISVEVLSDDVKNTIIQLAKTNNDILHEANQQRSHGFKFIWTKNGKV